ncbi:MAG: hypothetical protein IJP07_01050 [Firmicutes bacterium]|nr:hypothetical protein [Bacillota bacterium]
MELGLTWPLQRQLHCFPSPGEEENRLFCWDAHCIRLRGESCLLLVHCASRYSCLRFAISPLDWARLPELMEEELRLSLAEAGLREEAVERYLSAAGPLRLSRTHGRREVAFLNRAWEDVLAAEPLLEEGSQRQPLLNCALNELLCRCAGEAGLDRPSARLRRMLSEQGFGKTYSE